LAQRSLVRLIVPECPDILLPRLLSLYSNLSLQAGWLSYDLNDFQSAAYYYEHARTTAHDALNTRLGALVLCTMSHLATWQGNARVGIDHAVAAQNWAGQIEDHALRAYASDVAARAYSADDQPYACSHELESAETYLVAAAERASDDRMYFYTPGQLAGTTSLCYLRLEKTEQALSAGLTALALVDSSFVRNVAFTKLYLANSYRQAHEIEEGAHMLSEAAVLATRNRSARLVGQLRKSLDALQPWQDTQPIQALNEQLIAYGLVDGPSVACSKLLDVWLWQGFRRVSWSR